MSGEWVPFIEKEEEEDNDYNSLSSNMNHRRTSYSSFKKPHSAMDPPSIIYQGEEERREEGKEGFDTWRLYADQLREEDRQEILNKINPSGKEKIKDPKKEKEEEESSVLEVSGTTKTNALQWLEDKLSRIQLDEDNMDLISVSETERNPYKRKFKTLIKGLTEERNVQIQKQAITQRSNLYISLHAAEREVERKRKLRNKENDEQKTVGVASFWRLQKEQALSHRGSLAMSSNQIPLGELRFKSVCEWAFVKIPAMNVDQLGKPVELDLVQKMFINAFLSSCAPLIYGIDWMRCQRKYYEEHHLTEVNYHSIVVSPRRFGKTWSVAIFVLALLWCVPGITIAVFSTNQRTSEAICGYVRKFLFALPDGEARLGRKSKKEIAILPADTVGKKLTLWERQNHPNSSVMLALPATGDGEFFFFLSHFSLPFPFFLQTFVFKRNRNIYNHRRSRVITSSE